MAQQRHTSLVDFACLRAEHWLVAGLHEIVLLPVVDRGSLNGQRAKGAVDVEALLQRGTISNFLDLWETGLGML